MLDRIDKTIVAVSSAAGHGPLGIVRLSGPNALAIVGEMIPQDRDRLTDVAGFRRVSTTIEPEEDLQLPAAIFVFRTPRSYTRQDMVEIHTIGSPVALEAVRRRCAALGALPAEAGEFTARAFVNGAMDLASAEAVAGVIRAQSDAQLRAARKMMDGGLARGINGLRETLADLVALVEADIDFSEEPIDFIKPSELQVQIGEVVERIDGLLVGAVSVERFDVLPRILLIGPPNAGKSSLLNRLSGTSRAICAAAAGTTRDVLTAPIRLGRGEALLLDSAGVDESEDEIIAMAREMALCEAERVDLLCMVVDAAGMDGEGASSIKSATDECGRQRGEPRRGAPDDTGRAPGRAGGRDEIARFLAVIESLESVAAVVAANKCDLLSADEERRAIEQIESLLSASEQAIHAVCAVSALTGEGIETLRNVLADQLVDLADTTAGESILLAERQRTAITEARHALGRAIDLAVGAVETIDCADLLAFEIREALDHLGSVTGEVTTDDLLARVFARFCIGK